MTFNEWEAQVDRLKHDAEHKEAGAALARTMGDARTARLLDAEAAELRQRCADLEIRPPVGKTP